MSITSRICRVCRTEVLTDAATGAEQHRDIAYDNACRVLRNGRTERETILAALRSIDQTGSLRAFRGVA